jgi:hypothetical protein
MAFWNRSIRSRILKWVFGESRNPWIGVHRRVLVSSIGDWHCNYRMSFDSGRNLQIKLQDLEYEGNQFSILFFCASSHLRIAASSRKERYGLFLSCETVYSMPNA